MDPGLTLVSAAILLVIVVDPLGNVPTFLSILGDIPPSRRRRIILRESLIAYGILLLFLVGGRGLLSVLRIEDPALTVAGGVILFLIALRMIFPHPEGLFGYDPAGEPLVVPLATPLIAGPSAMATVLLLVSREPDRVWEWAAAISLAACVSTVVLLASEPLSHLLGKRGLHALQRLMGMLLTAVAVQMFLTGVERFLGRL